MNTVRFYQHYRCLINKKHVVSLLRYTILPNTGATLKYWGYLLESPICMLVTYLSTSCSGFCGKQNSWKTPVGHDTGIKVYNSLTRRKEPLLLRSSGTATWKRVFLCTNPSCPRLSEANLNRSALCFPSIFQLRYSCGPTVYDHAHLGHACSYVRFDIIRRILSNAFGTDVIMAMVITDIDDKIIRRSQEVLPPTVYLRVTDNVPHVINFIQGIINNGHAYATAKGNVYFDIKSIGTRYGKLVPVGSATDGEQGHDDKRDTQDFSLWKTSKPQEPFWDSPWGKGRPGWHIECSTVASLVFGKHLDIHTGGIDLAFPHHENEIAQSEAYHQCEQWGNYFLHSGHLHLKGQEEKMSKSLKNYITIKDFLHRWSANHFRMFCLLSKYRSSIEYSETSMDEAKGLLHGITSFISEASAYMRGQLTCNPVDENLLWERLDNTKENVKAAFADDFDTLKAVDAVMDLIHHGNRQLKTVTKESSLPRSPVVYGAIVSYVQNFLDTVGISLTEAQLPAEREASATLPSVVQQLVDFRSKVRTFALAVDDPIQPVGLDVTPSKEVKKQLKEKRKLLQQEREPLVIACDVLRQDLAALGINVKDRGNVSTWELTSHKVSPQTNEEDKT
ncbi:probable cysteine--tRNA ligase, mitochondrial isoform X2 [Protopterus annectens]|uniref:probable cysteine--tRNA ligase, mitochondrial isoform X2 n=1 Tax=Protopterus annectens TaxID=7888 RepID=UPI001CFA4EE7|nr:probable cysteine--tRNA ligase, mitochondrial isoform X2 [Protopterus annectens]